jgi:hypothetical protein
MDGTIYVFFRMRYTEAWYQLSQAERDNLFEKIEALGKSIGIQHVLYCNSRWSNERWLYCGVEAFPDMAAYRKYNMALEEIDWFRYVDSETNLGTALA